MNLKRTGEGKHKGEDRGLLRKYKSQHFLRVRKNQAFPELLVTPIRLESPRTKTKENINTEVI